MKLILDIENSITRREDGTIDNSPFNPSNQLVSVGFKEVGDTFTHYYIFNHNELYTLYPEYNCIAAKTIVQSYLDKCTLLIGHNIKYDLKWLKSCGFTYDGEVYDTMVHDYVLLRGMKQGLSLEACLQRHGLEPTKSSALKDYYAQGLNTNEIPLAELIEYGKNDVVITEALYNSQQLELQSKEPDRLRQYTMAIKLMNDFLPVLVDMELAGVKLDIDYLNLLDTEYTQELEILENKLHMEVQKVMGDRPINLSSTDHKSQLLFSRVVTNKNKWKEVFNLGTEERNNVKKKKTTKQYSPQQFARYLKEYTYPVYKTKARKCTNCDGKGHFYRTKKDGTNYSKATKCPVCNGTGVEQVLTQDIAGLQLVPLNRNVSAAGFSSDSDVIEYYLNHPRTKPEALPLLKHINRYNKLSTWKNTFIAQLLKFHHSTILHASYNQCVTATGRLSCTEPNLQNQPARDPEFKIKKAFISRWKGGCITDADFGQLEFRIAAYLSQCPAAINAVVEGIDIHSMTRDFYHGKLEYKPSTIQPTMTRQQAKAHTFGPLYGKYTEWTTQFYALFPGIKVWHDRIMKEVVETGELCSPSGRVYAFKGTQWFVNKRGERLASGHTQIKNYTVQGFATGDIVLLVLIDIHKYLKQHNAKSKLILQVHDSAATDTHPDEYQLVEDAYRYAFDNVYAHAKERWGLDINIPLAFDLSRGYNWNDTTKIEEFKQ